MDRLMLDLTTAAIP